MSQDLNPVTQAELYLPGLAHAFFTRQGGVSEGIYKGLNTGLGSDDKRADVLENRRRVLEHFGEQTNSIAGCHQIHSVDVITLSERSAARERPKADALVTGLRGVPLSIQTADCGPVLFADTQSGVVGAAHAGWKGATGGILENTIAAMEKIGAQRQNIVAVLGPTISQANYEVGPEFAERLTNLNNEYDQYLIASQRAEHFMFDLPAFIVRALKESGIAHVGWTGHCTYADEQNFFSYRRTTHRAEADYGRQTSAIMLLETDGN